MNHEIPGIFRLESGKSLSDVRIEYEMYGKMNADKSNVILICHALSGVPLQKNLNLNQNFISTETTIKK